MKRVSNISKKSLVLLVIVALAVSLCLCGCGTVSTDEAQSYLDGQGDTAKADTAKKSKTEKDVKNADQTTADNNADQSKAATDGSAAAATENGNTGNDGGTTTTTTTTTPSSSSSGATSQSGATPSAGSSTPTVTRQCTISIDCMTILNNMASLNSAKTGLVPSNGMILNAVTVSFNEGDSVLDVLKAVTRQNGIQMEFENTPAYGGAYIKGIANLYEFDCGDLSGWQFCVNNWYPNYACNNYIVSNGDVIQWRYTCNVGKDL